MFKLYSVDILDHNFLKTAPLTSGLLFVASTVWPLPLPLAFLLAKDSDQSLGFAGDWSRARGEVEMPEILQAEIVKQ